MTNQQLMVAENHELISAVADIFRAKKEIEDREKILRAQLLEAFEKYNVLGFDNDEMTVTYIPETTRESLDSARLLKDHPEFAIDYYKTSKVKASLRVKVKDTTAKEA